MAFRLDAARIWSHVDGKRDRFATLSDNVWSTPELNYREIASADAHEAMLQAEGFRVSRGVAGLPTALIARLDGMVP